MNFEEELLGCSHRGAVGTNLTRNHEVGGSNPELLWLWLQHRPAATALIHPLAWELPYATGAALKSKGQNKQTEKKDPTLL